MKRQTAILLLFFTAALLWQPPASSAQDTSMWGKTALGAAPATDDKIILFDTSTGITKTATIANLFTSAPLVTPTLGVATATSINGLTIDTTTGTLDITNSKTLAVTHTLTLAGTDGTTMTFPSTSATLARTDAANTFTGVQTMTSPVIATPSITDLTEVVTATNVIAASESGAVFYLSSATEFVSTLPAPAAGLHYTFIVTAAPSGASYTVVTNGSANIIKGNQNSVAGDAGDFGTSDDTVSFVDGQSVAGDKIEVWCDGTNWFIYAISKVAAGITFTTAS